MNRIRRTSHLLAILLLLATAALAAGWPAPSVRAASAPAVSVRIANYAYEPAILVIAPGTTVRWVNQQRDANDVVAYEGPTLFRSPQLLPGEAFSFTFTAVGVYRYACTPHPFMRAEVHVVPDERAVFPETGVAVEGAFLRYWRGHGLDLGDPGISYRESLALFGLPLGPPSEERIGERTYTTQYFERARLEYHPENLQPSDILLGQFGRDIRPPNPPVAPRPGAAYFPETGHTLDGVFRRFWEANGGVPVFGYPLSEELVETLGDAGPHTVQYFERARLEWHPENAAPYDVLLGQFGRLVRDGR